MVENQLSHYIIYWLIQQYWAPTTHTFHTAEGGHQGKWYKRNEVCKITDADNKRKIKSTDNQTRQVLIIIVSLTEINKVGGRDGDWLTWEWLK